MDNAAKVMAILALALAVLPVGALAQGGWTHFGGMNHWNMHHGEIEELLETGTYEDFQEYRSSTGVPMMWWIDSEEEFVEMQERHEEMERVRESGGRGFGCHMGGRPY